MPQQVVVDPSEVKPAPIEVDPSEVQQVDPADVTIAPDPTAVQRLERDPGIPLYQFAPGAPQKDLPPMSAFEQLVTNPAKQIAAGAMGGVAGATGLTGNIAHLLDSATTKISDLTGIEKGGLFKHIEDWAKEQQVAQEQQASELRGGRDDLASQLYRLGGSTATSLPTYAVAAEMGGPIAGMAGLGALETADQGPANMLKAAAQNALAGKALEVMGPASRPIRLFGAGAMTYAQLRLQGVDHETALANAMTMAGMAGLPSGGKTARQIGADLVPDVAPDWARKRFFDNTLNPVQQRAVDYLRSQGVPLTGFQLTGNRFLAGVEATTAHKPLGAQLAREFHAGTQEAMGGLSGKLAEEVHPEPVTPYEAGKAASGALDQHIAELNSKENDAYSMAWQHAGKPEFTKRVIVKTTTEPLLDEAGEPTGERQVPVYRDVNMPVDVRWMKDIARDQIPKYEYGLSASERSQSKAYGILKKILKGNDYITAEQAEEALKGLKAEVGYGTNKNLRNASQGTAAQLIPQLQKAVDAAVAETGEDSVAGLQAGRQLHAQKMEIADISKKLREEPVQAFGQLAMARDAGVDFLKEVAKRAPDEMPKIGRAYLDNLFDQATREGGWMRADGVFRQWDSLGNQTKALLFPKAGQVQALDRFFLASKITSERINTSGTQLTKAAEDAGVNVLKWLKGRYMAKVLFTPKGIQFLTGIAQNPPRSPSESAAMKAQAARVFGPPKEPPEPPPEGQPPSGGGPPSTPPGGGTGQSGSKLGPSMKVNVVRHQTSPGVAETGSAGGTFYLADTPENAGSVYKRSADQPNYVGSGGTHEIRDTLELQNPLLLPHGAHQLGQQIMESLTSLSRSDFEALYQGAAKITAADPNIQAIAEDVGLPVDTVVKAIKAGQQAGYDETGPMDAIAVELLKKNGHDGAVQVSGDAKTPSGEVLHVPPSTPPGGRGGAAPQGAMPEPVPPLPATGGPAASMGKGPEQALAWAQEQMDAGKPVIREDLQRRFKLGYGAAQKVMETAARGKKK